LHAEFFEQRVAFGFTNLLDNDLLGGLSADAADGRHGDSQKTQAEDLENAFEFIPGRLYYVPLRNKPHKQKKAAFFSVDEELVYWNSVRSGAFFNSLEASYATPKTE